MAEPVNTGMPKAEMKKLLIRSKAEPVNCAIGSNDGQVEGLLVMHRAKNGKACEKIIKDTFPNARNTRFGMAFVDIDDDPKLVKITLNRAVGGMAKRLTRTLKGTGFTKVVIVLEDGSAVESHEDAEEQGPASTDDVLPAATAGAEAPTAGSVPRPPPGGPAPISGPTAEEKAARTAELQKALTTLAATISHVAGVDAELKARLIKLATDANTNIKFGNLVYAANFIDQLRIALEAAKASAAAAGQPAADADAKPVQATLQTLTSSRQAWTGTQQRVKAEVEKLRGELARTFQGETFAAEIGTKFEAKALPIMEKFDDRLLDVLDDAMSVPEGAERAALIVQGKAVMKDYLSFAMTEPLIKDLDSNPFVPLNIRATVTTTLAALAKVMH